jgi:hypothetical protein
MLIGGGNATRQVVARPGLEMLAPVAMNRGIRTDFPSLAGGVSIN